MALFAVRYDYDPAGAAARDETRPAHREWLAGQASLRLSGPTTDDGAVLIFEGDSADAVAGVLDQDPFWRIGTILKRTVSEWNPVLGPWRDALGL